MGHTYSCRTFLSKISVNVMAVQVFNLHNKWVTLIHVTLFWAKVLLILWLSNLHERGHIFYVAHFWAKLLLIYIELWRFGQPTRPYLSVFPKTRGHTLRVALFWSKFVLIYSCEGLVIQLDHTCLCLPHAKFC